MRKSTDYEASKSLRDRYPWLGVRESLSNVASLVVGLGAVTLYLALDWADDIFNSIGVPNFPGVGFVKSAIRFVGNMILGLVHLGVSILKPIIGDAWGAIEHAADLAAHGIYDLAGKIESGILNLTQMAYGWVLNAIKYGEDFVRGAIRDVTKWATDLIDFLGGAINWLNQSVIQPLWHFAHDAWDYLTTVIIPGIINEAKRIEHDLGAAIYQVASDVGGILNTLAGTVLKWAPVIEKAFGWLVWFALHPFDEAESIWSQFTKFDPRGFIDSLTGAIDSAGQGLEDWIVKWLGG